MLLPRARRGEHEVGLSLVSRAKLLGMWSAQVLGYPSVVATHVHAHVPLCF